MHTRSSSTRSDGAYRAQAEINITPLVDVMLVLLIVFMVTAPLLTAGLHVELPQTKAARTLKPDKPVILTISKDGAISLGEEELSLDQVVSAVMRQTGGDLSKTIHLQADKAASHGAVVAVLDVLAAHALTHIAIITNPVAVPQPGGTPAPPSLPAGEPGQ